MTKVIVSRRLRAEIELLNGDEWAISNGSSDECFYVNRSMECFHPMRVRAKGDVGYPTCSWEACPIKTKGAK